MAVSQPELWCRSGVYLWGLSCVPKYWEVSSALMDLQVELSGSCNPGEEDFFHVLKTKFSYNNKFLTASLQPLNSPDPRQHTPAEPHSCLNGRAGSVPPQISHTLGPSTAHAALHVMISLSYRAGPLSSLQQPHVPLPQSSSARWEGPWHHLTLALLCLNRGRLHWGVGEWSISKCPSTLGCRIYV